MSVRLRTKWFWVRVSLLSLKLEIWRLLRARSFLTFKQTIECGFTLKLVHDMIITYRQESILLKHNELEKLNLIVQILKIVLDCVVDFCLV